MLTGNVGPAGYLQPVPIPERVWDDTAMDFIEGLPISYRLSAIWVIVDRFSNFAHFIPLKHPYAAPQLA